MFELFVLVVAVFYVVSAWLGVWCLVAPPIYVAVVGMSSS